MPVAPVTEARLATRSLLRTPWFLLVATLTLALGVGSVSAIYTVISGTLLQPLPYPDAQEVVRVDRVRPPYSGPVTRPVFTAWREGSTQAFRAFAAYTPVQLTLSGSGEAERVSGYRVTPELWEVLGLAPQLGRWFGQAEEASGEQVAVLSHALWQRRYGGDPGVVGRDVLVDGRAVRVVGVAPAALGVPSGAELFVPMHLALSNVGPGRSFLWVLARLAPGVGAEQALAALQPVNAALAEADPPNNRDLAAELRPLADVVNARVRQPLLVLMAASALVLLISCANLANLLLARASQRQRDLAVRAALGASRGSLMRMTMVEAAIIALIGGAAGVALAAALVPLLLSTTGAVLPSHADPSVSAPVVLVSLGVSLVTVVLFAAWPALRGARAAPAAALQAETRGGLGRRRSRSQATLVAVEVAISLTLLTGAGLLIESLRRMSQEDLGVRTERVLAVSFALEEPQIPEGLDGDAERQYLARHNHARLQPLKARLAALPGVEAVSIADALPTLVDNQSVSSITIVGEEAPPDGAAPRWANHRFVEPNYFAMLGIPLRQGRLFAEAAHAADGHPQEVVVNDAFVRRYLGGRDPIGVRVGNVVEGDPRIVGVVADTRLLGPDEPVPAQVFLPASAMHHAQVWVALRTQGQPAALASGVREALRGFDANIPLLQLQPLDELVARTDRMRQFNLDLMLVFSTVALLLTGFGLYAVIAYLVAQRRQELGIRMSLGADGGRIVAHVLGRGLRMVGAGLAVGVVGALLLGRVLASQLFGIASVEPAIIGAVVVVLVLVSLAAAMLPAWRATRIPAVEVLRGG